MKIEYIFLVLKLVKMLLFSCFALDFPGSGMISSGGFSDVLYMLNRPVPHSRDRKMLVDFFFPLNQTLRSVDVSITSQILLRCFNRKSPILKNVSNISLLYKAE